MAEDSDLMLGVAAIFILGSIIGVATNTLGIGDLIIGGVLLGVVGVSVFFTKENAVKQRLSNYSSNGSSTGINYSYSEGKEVLNDWAENEFTGNINKKKGVKIDQFRSESEPTPVISDPSSMDFVYLRHYYVTHGDRNQPMDFFVDVTNGEYFAHKQVNKRRGSGERNPFEKLDAYRKTKHFIRRAHLSDDDGESVDMGDLPAGIRMDIGGYPPEGGKNAE